MWYLYYRVLLQPFLDEFILIKDRHYRLVLRFLVILIFFSFTVFLVTVVLVGYYLLVGLPLLCCINGISVFISEHLFSLGYICLLAYFSLTLLLDQSLSIIDRSAAVGFAVSDFILSSSDTQLQPSKQFAERQAALSINILWEYSFNVLLNKVDCGVRCLCVRLGPEWTVADEFVNEGIIKQPFRCFPE